MAELVRRRGDNAWAARRLNLEHPASTPHVCVGVSSRITGVSREAVHFDRLAEQLPEQLGGSLPVGVLIIRVHGDRSFYEAKWRYGGRQVKRRIGPAWVERLPGREWRRRRGRIVDGHFDERRAYVRMAELIAEHAEQADLDPVVRDARFEDVAEAWLSHLSTAVERSLRRSRIIGCFSRIRGVAAGVMARLRCGSCAISVGV